MQRVIIDTNVLVSALIQRSYPHHIINSVIHDRNIEWCISEEIFREYHDVLNRVKFSRYPGFISRAEQLLASVETICYYYHSENQTPDH